jgi:hypothetical protein
MRATSLLCRVFSAFGLCIVGTGALLTLGACEKKNATELVIVSDTDIPTYDGPQPKLVAIEFVFQDAAHTKKVTSPMYNMASVPALPIYLGLVSTEGHETEMEIHAIGHLSNRKTVERVHIVSFERGKVLELPMHLMERCETMQCESTQTCSERNCIDIRIPRGTLRPWRGSPSDIHSIAVEPSQALEAGVDAGRPGPHGKTDAGHGDDDPDDTGDDTMDAGHGQGDGDEHGDGDGDESGDGDGDGDDGRPQDAGSSTHDAGVEPTLDAGAPPMCNADLTSSPDNCGVCGHVCADQPNTQAECQDSTCVCLPGWADCKASKPGCDTDLSSWKTCGGCDIRCNNGRENCVDMKCVPK